MRYGSVCSGIEAASVAWKSLGWECVFLSEIEKFPAAVLAERFPNIPKVYLQAPVCRPGWLVEMECMAVKAIHNEAYKPY
jgi:site-specific DNA-cytosine methylase